MEVESFVTHVSVPSQKEVEDMLVRRKKRVSSCGGCTLALFIPVLLTKPTTKMHNSKTNATIAHYLITTTKLLEQHWSFIPMLNGLHIVTACDPPSSSSSLNVSGAS